MGKEQRKHQLNSAVKNPQHARGQPGMNSMYGQMGNQRFSGMNPMQQGMGNVKMMQGQGMMGGQ